MKEVLEEIKKGGHKFDIRATLMKGGEESLTSFAPDKYQIKEVYEGGIVLLKPEENKKYLYRLIKYN